MNVNPYGTSIIDLQQADLSNINFGLSSIETYKIPAYRYIPWVYLWLPYTILTNASFRHTSLDCAYFSAAIMDSVDLSFAYQNYIKCYDPVLEGQTSFGSASLVRASFYQTHFRFTNFYDANLSFANMYGFSCWECIFGKTIFFHANLSFSEIYNGVDLHPGRLNAIGANLSEAIVHSARYRSINFDKSDWSNAQATVIQLHNCTFADTTMDNCSFMGSYIFASIFQNASLHAIDLSDATLYNVTFIHSNMSNANLNSIKCDYCDFINVTLYGSIFKNASFRHSNFLHCHLDVSQLEEASDLSGSTLPNGTVVKINDER